MQTNRTVKVILKNEPVDARQWVAKYADYLYAYAMGRIKNEEQAMTLFRKHFWLGWRV